MKKLLHSSRRAKGWLILAWTVAWCVPALVGPWDAASAGEMGLSPLIEEALRNNPEILAARAKITTSGHKIPQATSLPDPMVSVGYQNEGFDKYSYTKSQDAQWMFGASQTYPFPGKRGLKGEMATKDAENAAIMLQAVRLKTVLRVKELYYDLFLAYKTLDILNDRVQLFNRVEDAALARYSSGMGSQEEAVMAQTEKYMLKERAEMSRQRIESLEAMLGAALGRSGAAPPAGRPSPPAEAPYDLTLGDLLDAAKKSSPDAQAKEKMIEQATVKVEMAKKEFYPDVTVGANYFSRGNTSQFPDMWSLSTQVSIPLYASTKQEEGVSEAKSALVEARHDLASTRAMTEAAIRDNYSMVRASERLMTLYKNGLIPKNRQDVQLAVAGYATGKVEAITAVSRIKGMLDYETSYWGQAVERAKAIARLEAVAGITELPEAPSSAQDRNPASASDVGRAGTPDTGDDR